MKKPIIERFYIATYDPTFKRIEQALNEMGAEWTHRPCFSNFHGIEFEVKPFTGRGSDALNKQVRYILGDK